MSKAKFEIGLLTKGHCREESNQIKHITMTAQTTTHK